MLRIELCETMSASFGVFNCIYVFVCMYMCVSYVYGGCVCVCVCAQTAQWEGMALTAVGPVPAPPTQRVIASPASASVSLVLWGQHATSVSV